MPKPTSQSSQQGEAPLVAPPPTSPAASRVGRGNRRSGTRPELALRRALHARGLRYYVDHPILANGRKIRPDIVFPRQRLAVFIDGCFWHGCPTHGTSPQANSAYWTAKFARNHARDQAQTNALADAGWDVLRVWEHEPIQDAVDRVVGHLSFVSGCSSSSGSVAGRQ
jgi:DNA mismatch endonuclease (patch repair protein)